MLHVVNGLTCFNVVHVLNKWLARWLAGWGADVFHVLLFKLLNGLHV